MTPYLAWRFVESAGLTILPPIPGHDGGWVARTNGGTWCGGFTVGNGDTPLEAVRDAAARMGADVESEETRELLS